MDESKWYPRHVIPFFLSFQTAFFRRDVNDWNSSTNTTTDKTNVATTTLPKRVLNLRKVGLWAGDAAVIEFYGLRIRSFPERWKLSDSGIASRCILAYKIRTFYSFKWLNAAESIIDKFLINLADKISELGKLKRIIGTWNSQNNEFSSQ